MAFQNPRASLAMREEEATHLRGLFLGSKLELDFIHMSQRPRHTESGLWLSQKHSATSVAVKLIFLEDF